MKWQSDLIKDIKFADYRDDLDYPIYNNINVFADTHLPNFVKRKSKTDFSKENQNSLINKFKQIKDTCKCILEIGVSRDKKFDKTSTSIFLNYKNNDCIYLGVDIEDKTYLNNPDKNIHTMKIDSENVEKVIEHLKKLGVDEIDFLFIDGWHSINQVCVEWEYTRYLSSNGIVGFHDTAYHPGPYFFVNNLDTKKWHVISNDCSFVTEDYGIGYAWKKE